MSLSARPDVVGNHVTGVINYHDRKEMLQHGRSILDRETPGNTTFQFDPRTVPIFDARQVPDAIGLDKTGFGLFRAETKVRDFHDRDEAEAVYFAEVRAFMRRLTGAREVLLFGCAVRSDDSGKVASSAKIAPGEVRDRSRQGPALSAHIDYTLESTRRYAEDIVGRDEAEKLLSGRFSLINVWRGIKRIERRPLALCDGASIQADDLMPFEIRNPLGPKPVAARHGFQLMHNPDHRWYYFPEMVENEVLLFVLADSDERRTQHVGHTSFEDPTSAADAPPRESVEIRTICIY